MLSLPVAVIVKDEPYGVEFFCDSVARLVVDSIVSAPVGPGLALLSFDVERAPAHYLELICCLAAYNRYLRWLIGGDPAGIYDGFLRYEERNIRGRETFQSIAALFDRGSGDCADLVAARCAEPEVVNVGVPYLTLIAMKPNGGMQYHATVRYRSGAIEDPSAILLGEPSQCRYPSSPCSSS